jgi:hypothetical protein
LERVSPLRILIQVFWVAESEAEAGVEGVGGRTPAGAVEDVEDGTGLAGAGVEEEEGRRILSPAWIRAGFSPGLA